MVQSMTGFGKAQISIPGKNISIEIKSLNSKQQDFSVRMPGAYKGKEMSIRKMLQKALFRGKVECNINVELTGDSSSYKVNTKLVKSYFEQLKPLVGDLELNSEILSTIMRMPDVMNSDKDELEDSEYKALESGIEEALKNIKNDDQPFIIGGGEIYKQSLPYASVIELTRVHGVFDGDTYFPEIDLDQWKVIKREFISKDENHAYDFSFITYKKIT